MTRPYATNPDQAPQPHSGLPLAYTTQQAADLLQVSERHVRTLVYAGHLARVPHTTRVLIPRIALERFVMAGVQ
jgi:excisionase family DNA binding protein